MNRLDERFLEIWLKWMAISGLVLVLWFLKVFHFCFILVLLLIQEFKKGLVWLGEGSKLGLQDYWSAYWVYWLTAYIVLTLLILVWWFTWYRRKRPHLIIGGRTEGRVLWTKGISRGLAYDLWDAKNYLAWKIKKNPPDPGTYLQVISDIADGAKRTDVEWPDPLAIPLGRQTSKNIIYFSRPWSLKIERLEVPAWMPLKATFQSFQMPEGYIINKPDLLRPGQRILSMVEKMPAFRKYDSEAPQIDLVDHLDTVRNMVQASVAANPEVNIIDYEDGSYAMGGGE